MIINLFKFPLHKFSKCTESGTESTQKSGSLAHRAARLPSALGKSWDRLTKTALPWKLPVSREKELLPWRKWYLDSELKISTVPGGLPQVCLLILSY